MSTKGCLLRFYLGGRVGRAIGNNLVSKVPVTPVCGPGKSSLFLGCKEDKLGVPEDPAFEGKPEDLLR